MFLRPSGGGGGRESKRQRVSEVRLSKLGKRCQWGFLGLRIAAGLVGLGFPWQRKCILLATIYLHPFQPFPEVRGGRNGWMALDDAPTLGRSYLRYLTVIF